MMLLVSYLAVGGIVWLGWAAKESAAGRHSPLLEILPIALGWPLVMAYLFLWGLTALIAGSIRGLQNL